MFCDLISYYEGNKTPPTPLPALHPSPHLGASGPRSLSPVVIVTVTV